MSSPIRAKIEPITLLVAVGFLLAVNVNLAKAGTVAGASALTLAFWLHFGAGLALLAAAWATGERISVERPYLENYLASGIASFAFPGVLGFVVAERVGPAYGSVIYAFSPLITYSLAVAVGLDRLALGRAVGLAIGLAGTGLVVASRFGLSAGSEGTWVLLALLVPASVAFGNVLRTKLWPPGAAGLALAPGSLITAGLLLAPFWLSQGADEPLPSFSTPAGRIILAQMAVATVYYALFYRLQKVAGPVFLSQIGYVATGFGVAIAVRIFGDAVSLGMLAGIVLIVAGVLLVSRTTPRRSR
ncbi:MAG TPA: DMT family transporter [Microvirga sp.]|nr:DMT family transporter [Microvirga sp.]